MDAFQYGSPQAPFAFTRPITITVRYSDNDAVALAEETLALFYYDGTTWLTDSLHLVTHDTVNNALVVTTMYLTEFALFGQERGHQVYLPAVLRDY